MRRTTCCLPALSRRALFCIYAKPTENPRLHLCRGPVPSSLPSQHVTSSCLLARPAQGQMLSLCRMHRVPAAPLTGLQKTHATSRPGAQKTPCCLGARPHKTLKLPFCLAGTGPHAVVLRGLHKTLFCLLPHLSQTHAASLPGLNRTPGSLSLTAQVLKYLSARRGQGPMFPLCQCAQNLTTASQPGVQRSQLPVCQTHTGPQLPLWRLHKAL